MCELDESVFIQRCLESQKDGLTGTDKALTEKGAKGFYDKLWGLIGKSMVHLRAEAVLSLGTVAAKQNTRPEELRKLEYNPPTVWSLFQVRDYFEKELPAIDLDKLCPTMSPNPRRGRDFIMDMGE